MWSNHSVWNPQRTNIENDGYACGDGDDDDDDLLVSCVCLVFTPSSFHTATLNLPYKSWNKKNLSQERSCRYFRLLTITTQRCCLLIHSGKLYFASTDLFSQRIEKTLTFLVLPNQLATWILLKIGIYLSLYYFVFKVWLWCPSKFYAIIYKTFRGRNGDKSQLLIIREKAIFYLSVSVSSLVSAFRKTKDRHQRLCLNSPQFSCHTIYKSS